MEKISLYQIKTEYEWITESDLFKELEIEETEDCKTEDEKTQTLKEIVIKCYVTKLNGKSTSVKSFIDTLLYWGMHKNFTETIIVTITELDIFSLIEECTKRSLTHPETSDFYKKLLVVYNCIELKTKSAMEGIAGMGYLDLIIYLIKKRREIFYREIISKAGIGGHLEIIEYFFENYEKESLNYLKHLTNESARYGHLNILKFLFEKYKETREYIRKNWSLSSSYGHLNIIKYLIENFEIPVNWFKDAINNAVFNGHLNITKNFIENYENYTFDYDDIISTAASKGHFHIIKYFDKEGYSLDNPKFFEGLMSGTNLDLIKYLYSKLTNYDNSNLDTDFFEDFDEDKFKWYFEIVNPLDWNMYESLTISFGFRDAEFFEKLGFKPDAELMLRYLEQWNAENYEHIFKILKRYPEIICPRVYNEILRYCDDVVIMERFEELGMTYDEDTFHIATVEEDTKKLEIIKHLDKKGCLRDSRVFRNCIVNEDIEALKYLVEHNFPIDDEDFVPLNNILGTW